VAKKVLLLDLDNTLWGGLAGEADVTPITLSDDHGGLAYKNLQRVILQMKKQGVLLGIVSKNNEEDALEILQNHPLPQALVLLLLFGYRAQEELDGGEPAACDPASELALARQVAQSGDGQDLAEFYLSLEILTPRWVALLRQSAEPMGWVEELRAMARYGVERYWLQAVSDYDLVCRVKMIVAACLLVRQLGGNVLETAQLYSKEIENSGENVDAILDAAYTHPALTDANLLRLLALN
jgi:hypothetical protein